MTGVLDRLDVYMTHSGLKIEEVRCKGCVKPIQKQVQGKGLRPTRDYAELVIAMKEPNGLMSKHETGMCRDCKERILSSTTQDELAKLFLADIKQWGACGLRAGTKKDLLFKFVERQSKRVPVKALREAGRGEATAEKLIVR